MRKAKSLKESSNSRCYRPSDTLGRSPLDLNSLRKRIRSNYHSIMNITTLPYELLLWSGKRYFMPASRVSFSLASWMHRAGLSPLRRYGTWIDRPRLVDEHTKPFINQLMVFINRVHKGAEGLQYIEQIIIDG
jgi:hypothetical protein